MNEPSNIGLAEDVHSVLEQWVDNGIFREQRDAYKFAVAFALAKKCQPPEYKIQNKFGVASIDPDRSLYIATKHLCDIPEDESVYKYIQRLASWGVSELEMVVQETGNIELGELLRS